MEDKFYCNECKKDVVLKNGVCPECKTNWGKIIEEGGSAEAVDVSNLLQVNDSNEVEISNEEIHRTISFFLNWALVVKLVLIICFLIFLVYAIIHVEDTEGASLVFLGPAIGSLLSAFIAEHSLKWKAYLLYTNLKKNKK